MTPSLEPIPVHQQEINEPNGNAFEKEEEHEAKRRTSRRSNSWDARYDLTQGNIGDGGGAGKGGANGQAKQMPRKLPALEVKGVALEGE